MARKLKRSAAATKGLKPKKVITGKQRKARKINIAVARKAKKKGTSLRGYKSKIERDFFEGNRQSMTGAGTRSKPVKGTRRKKRASKRFKMLTKFAVDGKIIV